MPRWKTQSTAFSAADLTKDQRQELLTGLNWFGGFEGDLARFEAAWKACRAELLPAFIAEHPGERPFAWWREHGRERPIVATWGDEAQMRACHTRYGYFSTHCYGSPEMTAYQEPEVDYLQRLGLLEPGELERYEAKQARELALLDRHLAGNWRDYELDTDV